MNRAEKDSLNRPISHYQTRIFVVTESYLEARLRQVLLVPRLGRPVLPVEEEFGAVVANAGANLAAAYAVRVHEHQEHAFGSCSRNLGVSVGTPKTQSFPGGGDHLKSLGPDCSRGGLDPVMRGAPDETAGEGDDGHHGVPSDGCTDARRIHHTIRHRSSDGSADIGEVDQRQ
jgi:hypothetical protein